MTMRRRGPKLLAAIITSGVDGFAVPYSQKKNLLTTSRKYFPSCSSRYGRKSSSSNHFWKSTAIWRKSVTAMQQPPLMMSTTTSSLPILNKPYMPPDVLPPKKNQDANSTHRLSRLDLQRAMTDVKRFVEQRFEEDLNIVKHAAPLAFMRGTGVNDELDGSVSKRAVRFTVPNKDIPRGIKIDEKTMAEKSPYEMDCEVVQSLAKWKRIMLDRLGCQVGEGMYCDSTSIRKGYKGDVTHSVIADQWDFEIRINKEDRTVEKLKAFVRTIWKIITDCEDYILEKYPDILLPGHPSSELRLPKEIFFITSEDLHKEYPDLSVRGRETAIVNKHGAVFIIGMGWPMSDGTASEEVRAPGYDDWNMNGDIMTMHPLTEYRHELSSMGIRVDKESLLKQMEHRGVMHEAEYEYQKAVIEERLPYCYGGGLGISRLLMLLLRTGHIGEVQVGLWHDAHYQQAAEAGCDMIPDRIVKTTTHAAQ